MSEMCQNVWTDRAEQDGGVCVSHRDEIAFPLPRHFIALLREACAHAQCHTPVSPRLIRPECQTVPVSISYGFGPVPISVKLGHDASVDKYRNYLSGDLLRHVTSILGRRTHQAVEWQNDVPRGFLLDANLVLNAAF